MSTTVDPRTAVLSAMAYPPYNQTAESHCTPWGEAEKLLHAYRAAELRDFLWRLEQSAGDAAAEKFLDDNPELAALVRTEGEEV